MKYTLLHIVSLLAFVHTQAQFSVKGKVTDNNGAPVAFAFISASTADSLHKSVAQKISDTAGNYVLEIKDRGTYILRSSCVGYKDVRDTIIVSGNAKDINLVMHKSEKNLSDVSVTSKLPLIDRKIDRMVMNVENNTLTTGKSAQETIGLAPGIVMNGNQILLNGIPVNKVMVNGKLLQLSGQDLSNYLTSLRSEDIKSIEIMPHPPAEYDASGVGGIINIILKKQTRAGLNGSIYANYIQGRYAGTSDGASINFKSGKIGLFGDYSLNRNKSYNELRQSRTLKKEEGTYIAANDAINHYPGNRIHTGVTYDINDKQYVAVDYTKSFGNGREDWRAISNTTYPDRQHDNNSTSGLYPNTWNWNYDNVGLNYHLKTDTIGSEFTLLSDYTYNTSHVQNDVTNKYYNFDSSFTKDSAYGNTTPSTAKIFTADAKYLQKFKSGSSFSFGGKISATSIDNQGNFQFKNDVGNWQNNTNQNFIYNYKETILAGYVNYSGSFLNFDVQAGLRGENTNYTGELFDTTYVKNGKNYFGLFPSLYLRRVLNKAGDESIVLNYSRRLSRPDFDNLNPHVIYIDNNTVAKGNQYLQPQYLNSYEVNYTIKNKYTFTVNYTFTRDIINNEVHPVSGDSTKLEQQPTNSGNMRKWMASAYIPVNITKWWSTQNYIEYNYQHTIAPNYNIKANIVTLSTNQQFTITKGFSATLHAFYLNKIVFANALLGHLFQTDIALQKKLMKDRLIIKASLDDVFNTNKIFGQFYYSGFNMSFNQKQQSQKFTLGLTYNFDLGKAFKSHRVESSNNDEKSRLKQ